jgi:hypothetical protein
VYVSLLRFHINKCGGVFPVTSNTVPPASLERQGSPPGRPPLIPNRDDRRLPTKTSGVGVDFGNLLKAGEIVVAVAVSGVYHCIFVGSGSQTYTGPSRPSVTQRSLEIAFDGSARIMRTSTPNRFTGRNLQKQEEEFNARQSKPHLQQFTSTPALGTGLESP